MSRQVDDVIVVGGGPAGSSVAALLAGAGCRVTVLEQAHFPREKACAEFLSPGGVALLAQLGVLPAVLAAGAELQAGMDIVGPCHTFRLRYAEASVNGTFLSAGLGVTRPALDALLLAHVRRCGARVHHGVRVVGLLTEAGATAGVRVQTRSGERVMSARLVIAADGGQSAVVRALGLARPVRWPRRLGLVARYAGVSGLTEAGQMHVAPGAYCGLARVGQGLVSVGLAVEESDRPRGEPAAAFFERQLTRLPGVVAALEGGQRVTPVRGVGPIGRRVARVAGPGYLLVGDAAGFTDPFTGEGMYRALRGAALAAPLVASALSGPVHHPDLSADYGQARRHAFADRERVTWLIQAALAAPPVLDTLLRRLGERAGPRALLSGVLGDVVPASRALRPAALWGLLRPD